MTIYLADLAYDTVEVNATVPLNIGYIAAHLDEVHGSKIQIRLFKYPTELEAALKASPPDVLGVSNYSWSSRLSYHLISIAKRASHKTVTIMGGPNIRLDSGSICEFMKHRSTTFRYIPLEGEAPFSDLVGRLLTGEEAPSVAGVFKLVNDEAQYDEADVKSKPREIDLPSPYLSGWLDPFLKNPCLTPLLETNRGCPYGCVFCVWGIAALAKVRRRTLEDVFNEVYYIVNNSVGQQHWIVCDANFGILPRDLEIAKRIRDIREKTGYPVNVDLFHSKNTSSRNIEISAVLGDHTKGHVAVQSLDAEVLEHSGRKSMKLSEFKRHIDSFKAQGKEVRTDILLGLPGESYESHLYTCRKAFDLGFDEIDCYTIRLLPGSDYETEEHREKYQVMTKSRPIFGSYGTYDGDNVFEFEEGVRGTRHITEEELNSFKVIHLLIHYFWNVGIGKPLLNLLMHKGVNPIGVFVRLSNTNQPKLRMVLDEMRRRSLAEWFETKNDIVAYYEDPKNFEDLQNDYVKLTLYFLALLYLDAELRGLLFSELVSLTREELVKGEVDADLFEEICRFSVRTPCFDLFAKPFSITERFSGVATAMAMNDDRFLNEKELTVEFSRSASYTDLCRYHLKNASPENLTIRDVTTLFERGGLRNTISNKIRVVGGPPQRSSTEKALQFQPQSLLA